MIIGSRLEVESRNGHQSVEVVSIEAGIPELSPKVSESGTLASSAHMSFGPDDAKVPDSLTLGDSSGIPASILTTSTLSRQGSLSYLLK
jgi:hypothetical protein